MILSIFKKDLFSKNKTKLLNVSSNKKKLIQQVIKNFYNITGEKIKEFGAIRINSKNFFIKTKVKTFVLKQKLKANKKILKAQLSLAQKVSQQTGLLPKIIPTQSGNLLGEGKEGCAWILSEYIRGCHYRGTNQQTRKVGKALKTLNFVLKKNNKVKNLPILDLNKSFKKIKNINLFLKKNNSFTKKVLSKNKLLFLKTNLLIKKYKPVQKENYAPTHIDT